MTMTAPSLFSEDGVALGGLLLVLNAEHVLLLYQFHSYYLCQNYSKMLADNVTVRIIVAYQFKQ